MQPAQTVLNNRYTLLDVIGDGGMARVYRAHDGCLDRVVAVKLPHPALEDQADVMRRFEREARLVARLSHPHIVATYDVGRDGETRYLVMEYVDGGSLGGLLQAGPLPPARAVAIMEQIGRALDAAHAQGVVHRDIKPENVLLTAAGQVKVSDFGIAHALSQGDQATTGTTGLMFGSVAYVAPEQALGEPVTAAADIYSSGALLYAMLTGQPPFTGASPLATAMAHLTQEVRPPRELAPELPVGVDAVTLRALDKEPAQRYPSGAALAEALAAAITGGVPVHTATPAVAVIGRSAPIASAVMRTSSAPRGRATVARFLGARRVAAGAALLLAGMVSVFAVGARTHDTPPLPPARARVPTTTSESGASRAGSPTRGRRAPYVVYPIAYPYRARSIAYPYRVRSGDGSAASPADHRCVSARREDRLCPRRRIESPRIRFDAATEPTRRRANGHTSVFTTHTARRPCNHVNTPHDTRGVHTPIYG